MTEYVCQWCGNTITQEDLKSLPGTRCTHCGHRILLKKRPATIKTKKAI